MPKVLLLDTEPHLFELLKTKLEREGFEVLTGSPHPDESSGVSPDLIILDKRHHEDPSFILPGGSHTPVILLSSSDTDEESDLPHLKMPFRPNDLVELARKTVAG
jgi:DNA-binding response OmpR family regulator